MKKNNEEEHNQLAFAWLIDALMYFVIGRQVKTDKKGREFIAFKFNNDKTRVKSLVVYTTKKGDVRILANVTVLGTKAIRYNKSFCFLLKSINEEQFFLICKKQRMNVRDKMSFLELLEQERNIPQHEEAY